MQSFSWIEAVNILLQVAMVCLAANNHKAILNAHRTSFDIKRTTDANQEFIKDYLDQLNRRLKPKV